MVSFSPTNSLLADTGNFDQLDSNLDLKPFNLNNNEDRTVVKKLKSRRRRFHDFEDLRERMNMNKRFREEDSQAQTEPLENLMSQSESYTIGSLTRQHKLKLK